MEGYLATTDLNRTQTSKSGQRDLLSSTATPTNSNSTTTGGFEGINFLDLNLFLFGVISLIAIAAFALILVRKYLFKRKKTQDWKDTVFLEVSVPKESAEQVQKDRGSGAQNADKEMIGSVEQLFAVIAEYASDPFKTWLFGGNRFSFEIVNINQEIRFWIGCTEAMSEVLQRQIVAIYPKCNVTKLTKIDFFKENMVAHSQELELSRRYELPFKTFRMTESGDPINNITNALGGILREESAAIQLVLTPIKDGWQKSSRTMASKIQQGQNPEELLFPKKGFFVTLEKIFKGFFKIIGSFFEKKEEDKFKADKKDRSQIDITGKYEQIQLTPQQQEILKKLEEKSSKAGFYFTLRVVGSAQTKVRAKQIVDGILPAFQIYDIRPFNWFKKVEKTNEQSLLNFLLRAPNFRKTSISGDSGSLDILNTEEVASLWHIPNHLVTTPNIKWLSSRRPSIPIDIPQKGDDTVHIGTAVSGAQSKEIYLKREDRFRHIYSLGGSGSGKTVLMAHVILQDIANGEGVCVVDPHGDLIDDLLLRMPKDRIDDVIVFSPAITDRPIGLNMLEYDIKKPTQKTLVIDTLFSIWDKLYDLKKTGGPMFENYMKNSMRLVMSHPESGSTLMEISKVLVDEDFRTFKLAMCDEPEVVDFWEKEATKAGGEASLENMVPYITSKLAPFITNDFIKPMVGQQKSAINFREAMDNKKIILVKLEKGLIGETSAYLIGMVVVGNLLLAGMGRNDGLKYNLDGTTSEIMAGERTPFFVYIDEMQNFLFDAIPKALEEIRKYKVGFYLAHQFVKQVVVQGDERIKDSIMANCASKFIYRCGADDAQYLEKEFAPTLTASDLMTPERFTYNGILLVDGQKTTPFNIKAPQMNPVTDADLRKQIIENTKQKYGRPREQIEQEIRDRAKLLF